GLTHRARHAQPAYLAGGSATTRTPPAGGGVAVAERRRERGARASLGFAYAFRRVRRARSRSAARGGRRRLPHVARARGDVPVPLSARSRAPRPRGGASRGHGPDRTARTGIARSPGAGRVPRQRRAPDLSRPAVDRRRTHPPVRDRRALLQRGRERRADGPAIVV